jgi:hypothetical protein
MTRATTRILDSHTSMTVLLAAGTQPFNPNRIL